jgi:hypothetical protein
VLLEVPTRRSEHLVSVDFGRQLVLLAVSSKSEKRNVELAGTGSLHLVVLLGGCRTWSSILPSLRRRMFCEFRLWGSDFTVSDGGSIIEQVFSWRLQTVLICHSSVLN